MCGGGGRNKQEQYIWGHARGIETGTICGVGEVGINRNNTLGDMHEVSKQERYVEERGGRNKQEQFNVKKI